MNGAIGTFPLAELGHYALVLALAAGCSEGVDASATGGVGNAPGVGGAASGGTAAGGTDNASSGGLESGGLGSGGVVGSGGETHEPESPIVEERCRMVLRAASF